jgi:hypothetical protein
MKQAWTQYVEEPMRRAGRAPAPIVCISSPYRRLFTPLLQFLDQFRKERSSMIAVILPDLVEARWYEYLLHTQRANVLRSLLLLKGNQRVAVVSVPWYLERRRAREPQSTHSDAMPAATPVPVRSRRDDE